MKSNDLRTNAQRWGGSVAVERAADIDTNDRRVVYVTVNKSTGNMAEAPSKKPKKTRRPAFTEGEKMALVESFSIHADTLQSPLTNTILPLTPSASCQ